MMTMTMISKGGGHKVHLVPARSHILHVVDQRSGLSREED